MSKSLQLVKILTAFATVTLTLTQVACSPSNSGGTTTGNPLVADTSVSGAAAGAVGGALSGSSANSVVVQSEARPVNLKIFSSVTAQSTTCPTYASAGANCSATGSSMWLTYNSCQYPNSAATYTGVQAFFMSSGSASCGTFPYPGANGTLYRQYVTAAGSTTPSSLLRQDAAGTDLTIDNHTTNLSNFDSAMLTTITNGGYGVSVSFNSNSARDSLTFGHRINTAGAFDQTIYGSLTISESSSSSTSRSVSGSVKVYHNILRVIGTSTFTNVVHNNTCCLPVSGTITTTFSAGNNVQPTNFGNNYVGKTETLTLTGCGTGTLQNYDGTLQNVTLNRCF